MMLYKLLICDEQGSKIYVSQEIETVKGEVNGRINLYAGNKRISADIIKDKNLNKDEFKISRDVLKALHLPLNIKYQVRINKEGIRFGPVLGLLMAKYKGGLTKGKLELLNQYGNLYPITGGLIMAFSVEGMDFDKGVIEGYALKMGVGNGKLTWHKGIFPFPEAVYERVNPPEDIRLKLKEVTDNRMFNSYYFDKWQFYNMMSDALELKGHIPQTRYYSDFNDVDIMLQSFNSIYLKPAKGTLARGIASVSKLDGSYIFHLKQFIKPEAPKSKDKAESFINRIIKSKGYIVQQAVIPLKVRDRNTSFRVIMQKDETKKWGCTCIIALISGAGNICSNWGDEMAFEDLLIKNLKLGKERVNKIRKEIIELCTKACKLIDREDENYGDIGFDVIVDDKYKIWILEANKKHYHTVPLWIGDKKSFQSIKSNVMKYLTALSGFDILTGTN
ncbi:endospore coat-associated protein YheD [Oxobacter pfennigii]|uniref:Endospore coat-associated protein YheD n=1 Tax=Oxobacter pfennigii TaxID=36849 RepID=A0A0N8NT44_9CLOT|nr:YheC/YheD family protein [Oxobacter pfennigii]KPU43800.1 endospore coat-associated protein YheD [Oxobacter pfennigii]